uniref:Uncharacterized protein n=1 Tax=Oryza rufipogon TaxID=4529 RepID=A0A0E0QHX9_ORYRU
MGAVGLAAALHRAETVWERRERKGLKSGEMGGRIWDLQKPTKPPQSAQLAPTWNPYGPKSPIQVSSRNLLDAYTAEGHDSQLAYILDAGRSDRRSIVLNSTNMASTQGGHGLEPHPELHGCTTVTRSSRGQSSNSH